jgi:hypothetical protein
MWTSVQGSLELASKNFITGATKIVYAIIYSLILASLLFINWILQSIVFSPGLTLMHRVLASHWDPISHFLSIPAFENKEIGWLPTLGRPSA